MGEQLLRSSFLNAPRHRGIGFLESTALVDNYSKHKPPLKFVYQKPQAFKT